MHRTTNLQTPISNLYPKKYSKTYTQLNPQIGYNSYSYDNMLANINTKITDVHLQASITNLIRQNKQLIAKLNIQKQKNYDLLQLKRRLQDDIKRIQFELQRVGTYENLSIKQIEIKRNHIQLDYNKLKIQNQKILQENKNMRNQIKKWKAQCQFIIRQKQDLVNQNVILLDQIAKYKMKLSSDELQFKEYQRKLRILNSKLNQAQIDKKLTLDNLITIRSQNQNNNNDKHQINSKQFIGSSNLLSPNSQYNNNQGKYNFMKNGQTNHRKQISTNPSQNKISIHSPIVFKPSQRQKISQEFYQKNSYNLPEPSPRSFQNKHIQRNLQFMSPSREVVYSSNFHHQNNNNLSPKYSQSNLNSPSVFSYEHRPSPMIQQLKFSNHIEIQNQMNKNKAESDTNRQFLQTYQKKQLKDQVSSIRTQLVNEIIQKYYKTSLQIAQRQKSNSLKIFIKQLDNKIDVLHQMVMNYLEVRSMVSENCPTLRLKWEPKNLINNSNSAHNSQSQMMFKNSINLGNIYQSIKQNAKKQKTVAGQYLALFRFLTLLNKIEQDIDPLLIQCIKHSALKQIYRIKDSKDGKKLQIDIQ